MKKKVKNGNIHCPELNHKTGIGTQATEVTNKVFPHAGSSFNLTTAQLLIFVGIPATILILRFPTWRLEFLSLSCTLQEAFNIVVGWLTILSAVWTWRDRLNLAGVNHNQLKGLVMKQAFSSLEKKEA